VESMMECRLAGETEVLGENLPQRHFCPSQNPTCPPGFEPGDERLSYGAALDLEVTYNEMGILRSVDYKCWLDLWSGFKILQY
jgi:hypothetical protein